MTGYRADIYDKKIWNHLSGNSMVDTGILSNNMKSLSPKCYISFYTMTVCSDILDRSDITLIRYLASDRTLLPSLTFLRNYERLPYNICNGSSITTEEAYSSVHLVITHFGTCISSNADTSFSITCHFSELWISIICRYFYFTSHILESSKYT